MRALWLLLLLLPVPMLRAELQLWLIAATKDPLTWAPVPGVSPTRLANGATLDLSTITPLRENDILDLRFELRNTAGSPSLTVNTFRIQETGTSKAFNPMWTELPGTLAGGAKYTFEIRYLPPKPQTYEAILVVDQLVFMLRGSASGRTVMYEIDTLGQRQLINGSTSDFGNVRIGEGFIKNFRIVNSTGQGVVIAPPTLAGETASWFLVQAPESNRSVPPDGFYEFKVEFRPVRTGLINATLAVDGRTIKLVGNGLAGTVPDFRMLPSATDLDSASQAELRIELVSAAAQPVSGTLSLVFEKDVGEMPDDANIRFVATNSRSIAFTVPAGTTKAQFAGASSELALFQTGTASGKIRLVATLAQWEHSVQLNIRSDAPKLASGNLQRASGTLTVSVSGFDNTRSASLAVFRFFDADGRAIGTASGVEATVGDIFGAFYRSSTTGGLFAMRAAFPIQGDVNAIARVDIQLRNKLGVSQTYTAR
ncbi:MAG: choice-of-anchor D domain-containing protein [Bryobacterales bacterium]|nr:choice-of-anchor D domain-containing protein [Bryobacterales bacterium]